MLYNDDGRYNDVTFEEGNVKIEVNFKGIPTASKILLGNFIIKDVSGRNTNTITLTCMDYGTKFSKTFSPRNIFTGLNSTQSASEIVQECCDLCGVTWDTNYGLNYPNQVFHNPYDREITCGQVISAIAQINCQYVKMSPEGKLRFDWYADRSSYAVGSVDNIFGFSYDAENIRYTCIQVSSDGKDATDETGSKNYHFASNSSTDYSYCYVIDNNPIIKNEVRHLASNADGQNFVKTVQERVANGTRNYAFTPITVQTLWNPAIETGDCIEFVLKVGGKTKTVTTYVNHIVYTVGGMATYSCEAEKPSRNTALSMSPADKVERIIKKELERRQSDYESAYNSMVGKIADAKGFYVTTVTQEDGSIIEYFHNGSPRLNNDGSVYIRGEDDEPYAPGEPDFENSTFVMKHAGTVIAATTDNFENVNWAINVDGEFIAQQIATRKLIADDALIGNLTITGNPVTELEEEGTNPVIFQASIPYTDDLGQTHKGSVFMAPDNIAITSPLTGEQTKTLQEAFDETAGVWFGSVVPTNSNYPASDWDSDQKVHHVGNIYVNSMTGKQYRYTQKAGGMNITFSDDSELINDSYNGVTDSVTLYYRFNTTWYKSQEYYGCDGHNNIAGKTFHVPTNYLYVYEVYNGKDKKEDGRAVKGFKFTSDDETVYHSLSAEPVDSLPKETADYVTYSSTWRGTSGRTSGNIYGQRMGYDGYTFNAQKFYNNSSGVTSAKNVETLWKISLYGSDVTFDDIYGGPDNLVYEWEEIENYDLNTPSKILQKLTNNYAMEGIYMQNNKLYINMSYLRSGAIQIVNDIKDGNGNVVDTQEIFYAGWEEPEDLEEEGKNVVRIKADEFSLSSSGTYKSISELLSEGQLTRSQIIETLASSGDGIIMKDGNLYISFDYAVGGELKLGKPSVTEDGGADSSTTSPSSEESAVPEGSSSTSVTPSYEYGKLSIYSSQNKKVGAWNGNTLKVIRGAYDHNTDIDLYSSLRADGLAYYYNKKKIGQQRVYYSAKRKGNQYLVSVTDSNGHYNYAKSPSSTYDSTTHTYSDMAFISSTAGDEGFYFFGNKFTVYKYTNSPFDEYFKNGYLSTTDIPFCIDAYGNRTDIGTHAYFNRRAYFNGYAFFNDTIGYTDNSNSTKWSINTSGNADFVGSIKASDAEFTSISIPNSSALSENDVFSVNSSGALFGVEVTLKRLNAVTGSPISVSSDGIVGYTIASSIRYKDLDRVLTKKDIEALYGLNVWKAKYKNGYLQEGDQLNGVYMPMFVAEEVEEVLPEAVIYNKKDEVENWNERVIIPAMFQMIKSQREEITELKSEVTSLKDRLEKLEKILLGGDA